MKLDISTHKTILFQILKEIYSDTSIAPFLGFKGGTAALMFYGLDRFSIDLDFDLLDESQEEVVFERVKQIVQAYGNLQESNRKRFGIFYVLSYEDRAHHIKVEINRRQFGSRLQQSARERAQALVRVTRQERLQCPSLRACPRS